MLVLLLRLNETIIAIIFAIKAKLIAIKLL